MRLVKFFLYICYMEGVVIEIQERLSIGFAVGWGYYVAIEEYPYDELVIYLGIISINIKWQQYGH